MADAVEAALALCPWLAVDRVGDNVVARTDLGQGRPGAPGRPPRHRPAGRGERGAPHRGRCALRRGGRRHEGRAGRPPPSGRMSSRAGRRCHLVLLRVRGGRAANTTGCATSGSSDPTSSAADVAILGEPTGGIVEAGCQGTLRVRLSLRGARAHTARPATGRNAIHRLAPVLAAAAGYREPRPVLDGCEYVEQLQVVEVVRRGGRQRRPRRGLGAGQPPLRPRPHRRGGRVVGPGTARRLARAG